MNAQEVIESKELDYNQVKLSDGRIVEMRETIGCDEMVVAAQLGDTFEANGAGSVIFHTCLIAHTIVSIDGVKVVPMRNFEAVRDLLAGFKGRDYKKIAVLYNKLNNEGAEGNE